jgi:hypothetical protein
MQLPSFSHSSHTINSGLVSSLGRNLSLKTLKENNRPVKWANCIWAHFISEYFWEPRYFISELFCYFNSEDFNMYVISKQFTRPHRHKTFEYSQGNSQLKYLSQRMVELEISLTLITFSDLDMYRLQKLSAPPFSDSNIWVENFLENTQKFYDIGAWIT